MIFHIGEDISALSAVKERYGRCITVYGASHADLAPEFFAAARELGACIVRAGYAVVDGGGAQGLMGAVNDGALEAGGVAIGVIPDFMHERGWGHTGLTATVVTAGMHPRKQAMAALSDGVIAMPGGVGTFEEILEIMTWRKLGLYSGQAVLMDTAGYYQPLVAMMTAARDRGFINAEPALYTVAATPSQAVAEVLKHK